MGCGPGSISIDLASRVPPGSVLAVDAEPSQVKLGDERAKELGISNIRLMVGNADSFYCRESNFELVFSHALFEHLSDPEKTLKHLRDYLRLGGLIAVRSQDWGGFVLHPETSAVSRALETYQAIQSNYGGDVHCGRKLGMYLRSDSRPDPGDMSSSLSSSSVTGISSQLEDNSSQSSTAKANLSAVERFRSSRIFSRSVAVG